MAHFGLLICLVVPYTASEVRTLSKVKGCGYPVSHVARIDTYFGFDRVHKLRWCACDASCLKRGDSLQSHLGARPELQFRN